MSEIKLKLLEKAKLLPKSPGCYIMRNQRDDIIYVGKAKNLKNRVTTYFNNSVKYSKTQSLVNHIRDFEFFMTSNEIESLILENNLIKKHSPKYNIRLKDDKTYPYLQINYKETFPRLEYTRKPKRTKDNKVFGPFPESFQLKKMMVTLTKYLKLRDCSLHDFKTRRDPCMLFEMYQCSAPCVDRITREEYLGQLKIAEQFFAKPETIKKLKLDIEDDMFNFSKSEKFEKAIMLRDYLKEIQEYQEKMSSQEVELNQVDKNIDLVGIYFGLEEIDISIYSIRNSLLIGMHNTSLINTYENYIDFSENLPSLLLQYYNEKKDCPQRIYLDINPELCELLELSLKNIFNQNVHVGVIRSLEKLYQTTISHAENAQRMRAENYDSTFKALNDLKKLLKLNELPRKLECYDVAIFQGSSPAASQVVFVDGKADKKLYRYYKLEERPEGNNDFAMMAEVISRRIKHEQLPDIFIVDGGRQQVNMFLEVFKDAKIDLPVIGIAKTKMVKQARFSDKEVIKSEERLIIPGRTNPYILSKNPELFRLIVKMRDEAHRFSRKLHHKGERSKLLDSSLINIPGIGPKTAQKILRRLNGPVEELKNFSVEDLCSYFKIKKIAATQLLKYLNSAEK